MIPLRWVVGAGLLLVGLAGPVVAQDVVLRGGQLVDPRRQEVRTADLYIVDGRIAAADEVAADFAGEEVDARGQWIIPGLHDLHTHSFGNGSPTGRAEFFGIPGTAKRMLYVGVTGFLDLFNAEAMILPLRDRQTASPQAVPGADVLAAGPCLTATGGHCSEYGVPTRLIDTPEDARREIAELAERRPDVVKLVRHSGDSPTIDQATLEAAVAAANEYGLSTVVHIGSWEDAELAVRAGATAITHAPDGPAALPSDDLVQLMRDRGTVVIPTLTIYLDVARWLERPETLDDPLLQAVASEALLSAYRADERSAGLTRRLETAKRERPTRLDTVARLAAAGIPILTGTDSGNVGSFQGFSVHREMELLVEAGLSTWQALAASTTAAGDFLGHGWGLDPGDQGSVVVLDADPVAAIENTERIAAVIHHGRIIDREALLGN